MAKTILGIYDNRVHAEDAITDLERNGYNPKDISIVMRDQAGARETASKTGAGVLEGTAAGTATGAVLGGLAGLVAAIAVPGLGALFIGGPLAASLGLTGAAATTASGAATGALAGGLLGALTGLGLSSDDAAEYEAKIRDGGILVAVPARTGEDGDVRDILSRHGAGDIRSVSMADDRVRKVSQHDETVRFDDTNAFVRDDTSYRPYAGAKGGTTGRRKRDES